MNTLFLTVNNNGNGNLQLIPILTFPIVATFVIQLLVTGLTIVYNCINQEILVNIVTALIAAEIVCIITLILEHAFNKVDRLITSLKEEIKEKDEIIKRLLQKEDVNNGKEAGDEDKEEAEEEDEKNETKLKEL
jgi:hypothetical protein